MIPVIAGVAASLLPSVVSALMGSKSEKQAREAVAPQYDAMVTQMVGRGISRAQAEERADEQIKSAVSEKMGEGAIPPWLEMALSVPAYFAGAGIAKAGLKAAGKGIGKLAGAESAAAKGAIPEGPKTIVGQGKQVAAGSGDPTKFEPGSASAETIGRTKGELPAVDDPPQGIISPFGPRLAPRPRGTPIDNEFAEHSLQGKTGITEMDELPNEAAETLLRKPSMPRTGTSYSQASDGGIMPMSADDVALREATMASRRRPQAPPGLQSPFQPRLGYEPPAMPMDVHEERLMELNQHNRRTPRQIAYARPQPRLPLDEEAYVNNLIQGNPQGY